MQTIHADDIMDTLLAWWLAERRAAVAELGYPKECPSTAGYRHKGRWGEDDDTADHQLMARLFAKITFIVGNLPHMQRAALYAYIPAQAAGGHVWRSASVPVEMQEEVLGTALETVRRELSAGVDNTKALR